MYAQDLFSKRFLSFFYQTILLLSKPFIAIGIDISLGYSHLEFNLYALHLSVKIASIIS